MNSYDITIIGAGPAGIACAIEAQKRGLSAIVIEKGGIADAIRKFPVNMTFFSTPDLLELDDIPFTTTNMRPTRSEVLRYYAKASAYRSVKFMLHAEALGAKPIFSSIFNVETTDGYIETSCIIIATGYFGTPNLLGIRGEDLPNVTHYYKEPYFYTGSKTAVIGGRNSAVETALELFRHGAEVAMIHRGERLGDSVKYWIRPDIENRLKKGEITAYFSSVVEEIYPDHLLMRSLKNNEYKELPINFVIAHTGYRPDVKLLKYFGIETDSHTLIPVHNPLTFETNIPRIYVAGSVLCGCQTFNI